MLSVAFHHDVVSQTIQTVSESSLSLTSQRFREGYLLIDSCCDSTSSARMCKVQRTLRISTCISIVGCSNKPGTRRLPTILSRRTIREKNLPQSASRDAQPNGSAAPHVDVYGESRAFRLRACISDSDSCIVHDHRER